MKEMIVLMERRHQMTHGAHSPSTNSHQNNIVRISSKPGDVPLDPEQGQVLVMETKVARSLISLQREPAQGSQSVVDSYKD